MKSMVEAKPSLPKLSVANFKNSSLLKTQESESRASARTSTLQSFKRKKATNMLRKAASQLSPEKNILSMSTSKLLIINIFLLYLFESQLKLKEKE